MDRISPTQRISIFLIAIVSALLPLALNLHYHVSLIWSDSWNLGVLLVRYHEGILRFADFCYPNNEHRMVIPHLVMFGLARLTHWNLLVESFFGYAMVWLLSGLLALLCRTIAPGRWVWAWLLMHVVIFTPSQCENWMFTYCATQNFWVVPCLVAACIVLYRGGVTWPRLLLCAILVEIAALCLANGLLLWILLLPMILFLPPDWKWRRRIPMLLAWGICIGISLWIQFTHRDPNVITSPYAQADWIERAKFFLVFLGGYPLFIAGPWVLGIASQIGLILFLSWWYFFVQCVRKLLAGGRTEATRMFPWLALGAYAMVSAALGAMGRAGLGAEYATTSRYTTISLCLILALSGLILLVGNYSPGVRRTFTGFIIAGMIFSAVGSVQVYQRMHDHFRRGLTHLSFISILNDPDTQQLISTRVNLPELAIRLDREGYVHPPLIKDPDVRRLVRPGNDPNQPIGMVESIVAYPDGTVRIEGTCTIASEADPPAALLLTEPDSNGREIVRGIADITTLTPSNGAGPARFSAVILQKYFPQPATSLHFWTYAPQRQFADRLNRRS